MQEPFDEAPLMTSQYVPSGRDGLKVVLQALSALLIATKPDEPVRIYEPTYQRWNGFRPYRDQKQFARTAATPSRSTPQSQPRCGS